jgi:hypothetical protein
VSQPPGLILHDEAYISQLLSGKTNMTLRTLADAGFLLDIFVRLEAEQTEGAYACDSKDTLVGAYVSDTVQAGFWETPEDIEESVHYVMEPAA